MTNEHLGKSNTAASEYLLICGPAAFDCIRVGDKTISVESTPREGHTDRLFLTDNGFFSVRQIEMVYPFSYYVWSLDRNPKLGENLLEIFQEMESDILQNADPQLERRFELRDDCIVSVKYLQACPVK